MSFPSRISVLVTVFLACTSLWAQDSQPTGLDLFLLIGQSNMAGRGPLGPGDQTPIEGVYMLNKDLKWVPAVDPMHYDKPDIAAVGLGRTFARVLLRANPGAKIGLIPAAFGGTSLTQWAPGGKLYTDAVQRAKAAMQNGTLRGILWHQGEDDSTTQELASSYRERWAAFIASLRKDLNAENVPVVVGELGRFYAAVRPLSATVNEQLALIPLKVPHTAFASSEGLTDKGDRTHFDTRSYHELGRRYGLAYLALDPGWTPR